MSDDERNKLIQQLDNAFTEFADKGGMGHTSIHNLAAQRVEAAYKRFLTSKRNAEKNERKNNIK